MPYSWSYAPTDRATCKGKCKEKIPKGSVRLGVSSDGPGDYSVTQYRRLGCVTDKQISNITEKVGGVDKVDGFTTLSAKDQKAVLAHAGVKPGQVVTKAKSAPKSLAKKGAVVRKPAASPKRKAPIPVDVQHSFLDKAKAKDFRAVRALVEAQPDIVNCQPLGRWSALMQFAEEGNSAAVKFLIEHGADCQATSKDGKSVSDVAVGACKALVVDAAGAADDAEGDEDEDDEAEDEQSEEDEDVPEPPAKKAKAEAASSSGAASSKKVGGGKAVDTAVPGSENYSVVDDLSVLLNQTNVGANSNKYYKIQVLKQKGDKYFCWTHWGRVGLSGQSTLEPCGSRDLAEKAFKKKFQQKSGVQYENTSTHDWTPVMGKYTLVETDDQGDAEGGDSAPLGKLTPHQIEKGQDVLKKIAAELEKKGKKNFADLSSEFYTLIPHDFGMKAPPIINTSEMLEGEEELLKFYMRMGFEDIGKADDGMTPVDGIMDLALPKSLDEACDKLCGAKDIKASNDKGKAHSVKQSGSPSSNMQPHLYAAIMLYTSNAIYQDLNKVLRSEDRSKIKKYFKYLRLLLESLSRLPQQKKTVWRGVGVDLSDQYKVDSTITWWGVSSCTSDINVAKNFMKGCGGACTLLTIKSHTAADISEITFFGNEKENLLAPGTRLKVVSATKKGKVAEITLEELVGRALK